MTRQSLRLSESTVVVPGGSELEDEVCPDPVSTRLQVTACPCFFPSGDTLRPQKRQTGGCRSDLHRIPDLCLIEQC
jgi:hypothetical protein